MTQAGWMGWDRLPTAERKSEQSSLIQAHGPAMLPHEDSQRVAKSSDPGHRFFFFRTSGEEQDEDALGKRQGQRSWASLE